MKRLLFLLLLALPAQAQDLRYSQTAELHRFSTTTGTATSHPIQSETDALEYIMFAREASPVTTVCYRYGLRTGTPPTYKIGIETVTTATGRASGTYLTGTGECSATFTPPADTSIDATAVCQTLTGTTCALTRGQNIAITIRWSAGTIAAGNMSSFTHGWSTGGNNVRNPLNSNNTYTVGVAVGVGTKSVFTPPIYWKNTATGRVFGNPLLAGASTAYSSDSTPDERALRFQNPCPGGQQYEISGGHYFANSCSTGKTLLVRLYDGTSVLQTTTVYCDVMKDLGSGRIVEFFFTNPSLVPLNCGATYRIGIAPQEVTSGLTWYSTTVAANADFDAYPWGKETYLSTRTDAGAWTDVTTERPYMGITFNRYLPAVRKGQR